MSLSHLNKKVVIITGASRGLGRAIALAFGKRGCRVVVNYLSRELEARTVADDITHSGGEAIIVRADVRNAADVNAMMDDTVARWGAIDVLINNAGLTRDRLLVRMSEQDWDDVLDTNLKGAFNCIRAASDTMMKQQSCHIVNIASIVGVQGREGQANYSASKAGLIGLTKAAAREMGRFKINVNAILPGYLLTDMGDTVSDAIRDRVLNENVLNVLSDPNEVAEFICHLTTMKNVSGQVFNLDSRIV